MSGTLFIQNRQRTRKIESGFLREIVQSLLQDCLHLETYDLGIYLVGEQEMARVNKKFLQHNGPTDVITFDYRDSNRPLVPAGELFICVAVALRQGKEFRTTWQSETVRYIVHGILHLLGYDDLSPKDRIVMKRRENRLVTELKLRFRLENLGR